MRSIFIRNFILISIFLYQPLLHAQTPLDFLRQILVEKGFSEMAHEHGRLYSHPSFLHGKRSVEILTVDYPSWEGEAFPLTRKILLGLPGPAHGPTNMTSYAQRTLAHNLYAHELQHLKQSYGDPSVIGWARAAGRQNLRSAIAIEWLQNKAGPVYDRNPFVSPFFRNAPQRRIAQIARLAGGDLVGFQAMQNATSLLMEINAYAAFDVGGQRDFQKVSFDLSRGSTRAQLRALQTGADLLNRRGYPHRADFRALRVAMRFLR